MKTKKIVLSIVLVAILALLTSCNEEIFNKNLFDSSRNNQGTQSKGDSNNKTEKENTGSLNPSDYLIPEEDINTVLFYSERVADTSVMGTPANVVAKVSDAVVEIHTDGGSGSGVFITKNGYLVTCYHVVEGYSQAKIYTTDGNQYDGFVIGYDSWSDLAVLKVNADVEFTYAVFARSPEEGQKCMAVGEQVIAIGNPLGYLGGSVTVGYISALDREISISGIPMTLLQTDAAVSPGNSGGGLFNLYGELVGIVNAKSAVSNAENIGFAIPSTYAYDIVEKIFTYGYVPNTPYLGISTNSSTGRIIISDYYYADELAELNPELDEGFTIEDGDYLIKVGDYNISTSADIRQALAKTKVGDIIKITIYRVTGRSYFGGYSYVEYQVNVRVHEFVPVKGEEVN